MKKEKIRKSIAKFTTLLLSVGMLCSMVACNQEETKSDVQVYMPDGAPALALGKLLQEDTLDDGVTYTVVNAATINTYVTGEFPKADVCILPLNLASKLLGNGETYQMAGVVTHGNLYLLSTDSQTVYTRENLNGLVGKTVGVVQLANVPGLTFKIILNELDVPYQELANSQTPATDKVNLKAVSPDMVKPTEGIDVFVAPEPAASVKADKTPLDFVGDLQALYSGSNGYPQAVMVVKNSFAQKEGEWINSFLSNVQSNATWLNTLSQSDNFSSSVSTLCNAISNHLTEGMTPSLTAQNLSATAISHSGVRFESALSYKTQITQFLQKMTAVDATAAKPVEDDFYYGN